jgi:hypothetical protein
VVITNFYLDLFKNDSLSDVLQKIKNHLNPNAGWIAADFVNRSWTHRLVLKTMYIFFKLVSKIEASELPDWRGRIESFGARKVESKSFYGNFIETAYFRL